MSSNLPPGVSSPDGGIDHAYEKAVDELCEIVDDVTEMNLLKLFVPVLRQIYERGYIDGKNEALYGK